VRAGSNAACSSEIEMRFNRCLRRHRVPPGRFVKIEVIMNIINKYVLRGLGLLKRTINK